TSPRELIGTAYADNLHYRVKKRVRIISVDHSQLEHVDQRFRRIVGGHYTGDDAAFHLRQTAAHTGILPQAQHQHFVNQLVHPLLRLTRAFFREPALLARLDLVIADHAPYGFDIFFLHRGAGQHLRRPDAGVAQQVHRTLIMRACAFSQIETLTIGFVDDERIGQLHDAALDALQLVAGIRQHQHHEEINHARDFVFTLTNPDGFDQNDIVARSFAEQHGFARVLGHTAQRALGGRGSNERFIAARQLFHARLVAENRTPGDRRTRIDREHRDLFAKPDQIQPESFDESRLADTRDAGDADTNAVAGGWQQCLEHALRPDAIVIELAFDQS